MRVICAGDSGTAGGSLEGVGTDDEDEVGIRVRVRLHILRCLKDGDGKNGNMKDETKAIEKRVESRGMG